MVQMVLLGHKDHKAFKVFKERPGRRVPQVHKAQ
jgi:hypothetical protein